MKRFFSFILAYKKTVAIIFVLLAICSIPFALNSTVNYNITDYLPENAQSTIALEIMLREYGGSLPNARVMIRDVTISDALKYKQQLEYVNGVASVDWLDDIVGADMLENISPELLSAPAMEKYYKDNTALINVSIAGGSEYQAIKDIYELIGPQNAVDGDAVNAANMQTLSVSEVLKALAILLPIIIIMLLLYTTSWIEPLLFLGTIGIAVAINIGTSAMMGEISFITYTVSPILQLAVSLDYAIFLLHSFKEYRQTHEPTEAMMRAVKVALPTVAASAATTVIGFAALMFMQLGIGVDLGIHLAKGVTLSFISVMLFMPAVTLIFQKLIEKTVHKNLVPSFNKPAKAILKVKVPFLIIALLLVVPCFYGQSKTGFIYGTGEIEESTRAGRDAQLIKDNFGAENPLILLVPNDDSTAEAALCEDISAIPHVLDVFAYPTQVGAAVPLNLVPKSVVEQFYSENYARIIINTDNPYEGDQAFETVRQVLTAADRHYGASYLTGQSALLYDMKNIVEVDTNIVNFIAVLGIFLVILITFRSVILPILLVFTIETAIWINLSVAYFTGNSLSFIGYLIISTVQLGATVDYAILLTKRYMSARQHAPKDIAIYNTLSENLVAILVSAGILSSAGFTLGFVSGNAIVSELGFLLGRGTLLSLLMVVLVLPALLVLLDTAIEKTTFNSNFFKNKNK